MNETHHDSLQLKTVCYSNLSVQLVIVSLTIEPHKFLAILVALICVQMVRFASFNEIQ